MVIQPNGRRVSKSTGYAPELLFHYTDDFYRDVVTCVWLCINFNLNDGLILFSDHLTKEEQSIITSVTEHRVIESDINAGHYVQVLLITNILFF